MIDKIELRVPNIVGLPTRTWDFEGLCRKGGWSATSKKLKTPIVEISVNRDKILDNLKIESNLARIYQGHNARLLTAAELRSAAKTLADHVEDVLSMRLPPAEEWHVTMAEFAYDWIVPNPSAYVFETYRNAIQRGGSKRHLLSESGPNAGFTFVFGSKKSGGRIYDKEVEMESCQIQPKYGARNGGSIDAQKLRQISKGKLRFEVIARSKSLRKWLQTSEPTLGRVIDDLGEDPFGYVSMRWARLIPTWSGTSYAVAATKLRNCFPPSRAKVLLDAWVHIGCVGWEQYRTVTDVHRSTFKDLKDAFAMAGIGHGAITPLPPLHIDLVTVDGEIAANCDPMESDSIL